MLVLRAGIFLVDAAKLADPMQTHFLPTPFVNAWQNTHRSRSICRFIVDLQHLSRLIRVEPFETSSQKSDETGGGNVGQTQTHIS